MAKSGKNPGKGTKGAAGATLGSGARAAAPEAESTGPLGFETTLWQAADKLRNNMDAAEYKHVVLGLISSLFSSSVTSS